MGLRGISWPRAERRSAVAAGGELRSGLDRGTNINNGKQPLGEGRDLLHIGRRGANA